MATPEQISAQLDRLQSVLLTSGLQQKDPPLYQVISQLISALRAAINSVLVITGGGGGSSGLSNQPYLTHSDALATLPQSRELLSGENVVFDDSVFGERTVNVPLEQEFLTAQDETATLPNSRNVLAGDYVSFDDSVANERTINVEAPVGTWSVLTNGDTLNPEVIFDSFGAVIMTFTP